MVKDSYKRYTATYIGTKVAKTDTGPLECLMFELNEKAYDRDAPIRYLSIGRWKESMYHVYPDGETRLIGNIRGVEGYLNELGWGTVIGWPVRTITLHALKHKAL